MSELIVIRLREVEQLNPLLRRIAKEAADALEAQAKRIAELEAQLQSHPAIALGGPTPVAVAAPACERKE